jgi:cytochrome c oxidase subunit 2
MTASLRKAAALLPLLLCACSYQTYQSDFGGAAVQNRQFQTLFWIFLGICAVMYVLVIAFLVAGMVRSGRAGEANVVETGRHHQSDPLMRSGLIGWGAVIGTGLAALAIASFAADRSMAKAAVHPGLSITVTANQWWWDVQYNATDPSKIIRTANELHLPVGVPARIILHSNDVIHSFWVPSLAGKEDLIPGRETDVTITPRKIGIYRGQCAEFCGVQHAHMALVVNVDSYADFIKWWDRQMQPAPPPNNPLALAGYNIVTTRQCASCHAITGTPAGGTIAPDLTHLAGRRTIAAGTLPMGKANLYGWIADPQGIKPGSKMPVVGLEPNELHAVVAYLETLK